MKHASRHGSGGSDPVTPAMIGLENITVLPVVNGGTGAATVEAALSALGGSPLNHNHDTVYSGINHNHDVVYSPINHTHDDKLTASLDISTKILTIGNIQFDLSTLLVT
ncbi:MAG: hypothetical protein Q4Q53_08615 [Methanocorpusculum sp.]|nr:hypothetical protein [Methanocorpusculum sp.]